MSDRRSTYSILAMVAVALLSFFVPRTVHEMAIDRAKGCYACLDNEQAVVERVTYDSGWDGSSHWTSSDLTIRRANGQTIRHHDSPIDESYEEGQRVTLRFHESDLLYIDDSYAHRAWGGLEMLLFLLLPPSVIGLVLLWYTRSPGKPGLYPSGYITLTIIVTFVTLAIGVGARITWWPLPSLMVSVAVPTLMLFLRRQKHTVAA